MLNQNHIMFNYEINPATNCNSERIATVSNVIPFNNSKVGFLFMKRCTKCKIKKLAVEFPQNKRCKDGLSSWCRGCYRSESAEYAKTKEGVAAAIYNAQNWGSKKRGYDPPNYSLAELRIWIFSQPNFNKLYNKWVTSGYDKMLKPSCDRLDDYKSYTFNNLRLVTWWENRQKGYDDRRNGVNTKGSKAVYQYSIYGVFIKQYY